MTKSKLRESFKQRRKAFVIKTNSASRSALTKALNQQLESAQILTGIIGGYAAMTSEIDPIAIINSCLKAGRTVALPYFADRDSQMIFRSWEGQPLVSGPFGIGQPSAESREISPDTYLIPLVAVDRSGNRLGQGRGHYDRHLAKIRTEKPVICVGLAWECQIAEAIPADPWDVPLDYIATPERLISTKP